MWLAEASRLADQLLDPKLDQGLIEEVRLLHMHAAVRTGDFAGAEAILLRMHADSKYSDPMHFSYEIAEVLRLAGRYEEAIVYYDKVVAAWKAHIGTMEGHHNDDGTESVPRVLRGRAAALAALHRDADSQKDLDRAGLVRMMRIGVITSPEFENLELPGWLLSKIRKREAERRREARRTIFKSGR